MDQRGHMNPVMYRDEGGYGPSHVLGRLTCQDNRRAEEELAFPEFLMKAADGSRNVESGLFIVRYLSYSVAHRPAFLLALRNNERVTKRFRHYGREALRWQIRRCFASAAGDLLLPVSRYDLLPATQTYIVLHLVHRPVCEEIKKLFRTMPGEQHM
ncbi:hypothetical protein LSAT2_024904 [Lamellibrachia satsuma]|nr:hypothetical protein LSAT2_024904 [Lamellibrachia satsuma]